MRNTMGRWLLRVRGRERLTPHMVRVTLGGDLADFVPVAPDQQVKLFFARPGHGLDELPGPRESGGDPMTWYQAYLAVPEPRRPWMRTYSVRHHRPERGELDIDFVLHGAGAEAGPASRWAATATVGDEVGLVGPAPSHLRVPGPHDWTLLAGDETALPAIGALVAAHPAGAPVHVVVEVSDAAEEQPLPTAAAAHVRWVHRDGRPAGTGSALLDAVRAAEFPAGRVFAWVAGEASAVRALRRHLVGERGVDKRQVAFTGYWRRHLTQDADPTAADLADQAELMAELADQGGARA